MTRNVEIHSDVRLVDPSTDRLAAAVSEAVSVANAIAINGHLDGKGLGLPEIVGEGRVQAVADVEEGWESSDSSCLVGAVAVAGLAWWTSGTGKVHVRVCGGVGLRGKYQPVWMPTGVLYDLGTIRLFDQPSDCHNVHPERARRLALQSFGREWEHHGSSAHRSRLQQISRGERECGTFMHEKPGKDTRN